MNSPNIDLPNSVKHKILIAMFNRCFQYTRIIYYVTLPFHKDLKIFYNYHVENKISTIWTIDVKLYALYTFILSVSLIKFK